MGKSFIKVIMAAAFALVFSASAGAQANDGTDAKVKEYAERYNLLVSKLGVDGVGVETVLNNWAAVAPDDVNMLTGRFSYYFAKSQRTEVVQKEQGNLRESNNQNCCNELNDNIGENSADNICVAFVEHCACCEDVGAKRRCTPTQRNLQGDQHSQLDRIDPGCDCGWEENGDGNHNNDERIDEHTGDEKDNGNDHHDL